MIFKWQSYHQPGIHIIFWITIVIESMEILFLIK